MQPLDLRAGDALQQTLRICRNQDFGGTDCAQVWCMHDTMVYHGVRAVRKP
jgi:hypothetical protein